MLLAVCACEPRYLSTCAVSLSFSFFSFEISFSTFLNFVLDYCVAGQPGIPFVNNILSFLFFSFFVWNLIADGILSIGS